MPTLGDDLTQQIGDLLKGNLNTYLNGVKTDLKSFLQNNQAQISTWTTQLQNKQITQDDLKNNILNLGDVAKMTALTQAGIGQIQVQNIINGIIGIVVNKLLNVAISAIITAL